MNTIPIFFKLIKGCVFLMVIQVRNTRQQKSIILTASYISLIARDQRQITGLMVPQNVPHKSISAQLNLMKGQVLKWCPEADR